MLLPRNTYKFTRSEFVLFSENTQKPTTHTSLCRAFPGLVAAHTENSEQLLLAAETSAPVVEAVSCQKFVVCVVSSRALYDISGGRGVVGIENHEWMGSEGRERSPLFPEVSLSEYFSLGLHHVVDWISLGLRHVRVLISTFCNIDDPKRLFSHRCMYLGEGRGWNCSLLVVHSIHTRSRAISRQTNRIAISPSRMRGTPTTNAINPVRKELGWAVQLHNVG